MENIDHVKVLTLSSNKLVYENIEQGETVFIPWAQCRLSFVQHDLGMVTLITSNNLSQLNAQQLSLPGR